MSISKRPAGSQNRNRFSHSLTACYFSYRKLNPSRTELSTDKKSNPPPCILTPSFQPMLAPAQRQVIDQGGLAADDRYAVDQQFERPTACKLYLQRLTLRRQLRIKIIDRPRSGTENRELACAFGSRRRVPSSRPTGDIRAGSTVRPPRWTRHGFGSVPAIKYSRSRPGHSGPAAWPEKGQISLSTIPAGSSSGPAASLR